MQQHLMPLAEHDHVEQVRCLGAVGAVRMKTEVDVAVATHFFVQRGVWIRPIRDTIYLAPAFTIQPNELSQLCDAIAKYVRAAG